MEEKEGRPFVAAAAAARSTMADNGDDEVEYEPEEFQLGPHKFQITTIAFMPIGRGTQNVNFI